MAKKSLKPAFGGKVTKQPVAPAPKLPMPKAPGATVGMMKPVAGKKC